MYLLLRVARQWTSSNDSGEIPGRFSMAALRCRSNVTSIPAHRWAATSAVATSIAHKSEVASAKVPAGSIAALLARLELPDKPEKQSLAFFLRSLIM